MSKAPFLSFAGLPIFTGSMEDVLAYIRGALRNKHTRYICVTGAHGIAESVRSPRVYTAHAGAGLVVPDGMPLVWLGRLCGYSTIERIYGPDLFGKVCDLAQRKKWKIFLYGTTQKTLGLVKQALLVRYSMLLIAGAYAPPFRPLTDAEGKSVINMIRASGAQIVFVGMSTPRQELWMHEYAHCLHACVLIGVGAAFDFIADVKPQAPPWMRRAGLEWLFRLVTEPARLLPRYLVANTVFLGIAAVHIIRMISFRITGAGRGS